VSGRFCSFGLSDALWTAQCLGGEFEGPDLCHSPPVGEWEIVHNFPNPEKNGSYIVGVESTLFLSNPRENVYIGEGMGHRVVPSVGPDSPFFFMAIFNPEDCSLSGTAVNFEGKAIDVFVWYVFDGGAMHGEYAAALNETLLFTKLGRHDARYIG